MYRLKVAADKRHMEANGQHVFYIADTVWMAFTRLTREQMDLYLTTRAGQGFTAVQAVVLFEITADRYGALPMINNNPLTLNPAYLANIYYFVNRAAELGLYVGLLPVWGRDNVQTTPIITPTNARQYGVNVGTVMADYNNILWILGGDCKADTDNDKAVWRNMAAGLIESYGTDAVITYHPGSKGWSGAFFGYAGDEWCDVHGIQSGQNGKDIRSWGIVQNNLSGGRRIAPVGNFESCYEEQPISFNFANGRFTPHDIRNDLYRSFLGGADLVAYGHNSVWDLAQPGLPANGSPLRTWDQALDAPGANEMKHLKTLALRRTPPHDYHAALTPGTMTDDKRTVGALSSDAESAYIYTPINQVFSVSLNPLNSLELTVTWYNPMTGSGVAGVNIVNSGQTLTFTPPTGWQDAVLILETYDPNPPPDPALSERLGAVIDSMTDDLAELIEIKAALDS